MLREHFKKAYKVDVGLYSYGCFDPWRIPANTTIGRYCSFAKSARILDANHPMEALTTHPFIYEKKFGVVDEDRIHPPPLIIEDDVWLSHNVIVTPGCKFIGRGAVIGAGAVVTANVDRYAVVIGVPGKAVRYRFDPEMITAIEATKWWTLDKLQLAALVRNEPQTVFHPSTEALRRLRAKRDPG